MAFWNIPSSSMAFPATKTSMVSLGDPPHGCHLPAGFLVPDSYIYVKLWSPKKMEKDKSSSVPTSLSVESMVVPYPLEFLRHHWRLKTFATSFAAISGCLRKQSFCGYGIPLVTIRISAIQCALVSYCTYLFADYRLL